MIDDVKDKVTAMSDDEMSRIATVGIAMGATLAEMARWNLILNTIQDALEDRGLY